MRCSRSRRGELAGGSALEHLPNGVLSHSDLERVTTRLVDDLRRIFDQPVALVLTNVGAHGPGRGANAVLAGLLGQLPDALRLVIETHARPRLALSPLYAEQQLAGLSKDESGPLRRGGHATLGAARG